MKTFFKEAISMTLIAIAMVLILILLFYDYLKVDTDVDKMDEYVSSQEVKNVLADDSSQANQIIASFSKSMYRLDSDDVADYVVEGIIDKGKKHPFSNIYDNTYDGVSNTTNGNSNSNNNSSNKNNNNNNNNKFEEDDESETTKDSSDDKPFFDDGSSK